MSVTASRAPAPAARTAPLPAPTLPDREPVPGARAHPFAELLRQNRVAEASPVEIPRPPGRGDPGIAGSGANTSAGKGASTSTSTSTGDSSGSGETIATTDASPKSEAGRARARSGAAARSPTRPGGTAERPVGTRDDARNGRTQDDDRAAAATSADAPPAPNLQVAARPDAAKAADPALRELATTRTPRDVAATERSAGGESASSAGEADFRPGEAPASTAPRRLATDPTDRGDASRGSSSPPIDKEAAAATFAEAYAEAKTHDRPAAVAADRPALASGPAIAPQEPLQQAAPAAAATALASSLAVPIDSPDFASALGVQVSVFVRDGVQHAELHLNPAETGPVSIAITVDGTQARVEFGADLAATRQAIENGLPELASALRDAGFTLTGGGVAEHSRSGGGQGGDDPSGGFAQRRDPARGSAAIEALAERAAHRVSAGGVDLYA